MNRTGEQAAPPLDRGVRTVIAIVVCGAIITVLDATIVSVAIDTLSRSFGRPVATIQWVIAHLQLSGPLIKPGEMPAFAR